MNVKNVRNGCRNGFYHLLTGFGIHIVTKREGRSCDWGTLWGFVLLSLRFVDTLGRRKMQTCCNVCQSCCFGFRCFFFLFRKPALARIQTRRGWLRKHHGRKVSFGVWFITSSVPFSRPSIVLERISAESLCKRTRVSRCKEKPFFVFLSEHSGLQVQAGWMFEIFPCRRRSLIKPRHPPPLATEGPPLSTPRWLSRWHEVHWYFVDLTVKQAARCSLFLPQCHLSPITWYYANSSPNGAPDISAVIPQIDSPRTCARWVVISGRNTGSFQTHCSVYPSLWDLNITRTRTHLPLKLRRIKII